MNDELSTPLWLLSPLAVLGAGLMLALVIGLTLQRFRPCEIVAVVDRTGRIGIEEPGRHFVPADPVAILLECGRS